MGNELPKEWRDFESLAMDKSGRYRLESFHEGGDEENDPSLMTFRDTSVKGSCLLSVRVPEFVRQAVVLASINMVKRMVDDIKAYTVDDSGSLLLSDKDKQILDGSVKTAL